jgi:hypothetical protein
MLQGTCAHFCPAAEAGERRLHALEQRPPRFPPVKCFSRSYAGSAVLAAECRPEPVLCAVVAHLLGAVLAHPELGPLDGLVADRLRAVRADGFVQGLRSLAWCGALVRQVRYHLAAAYFLGGAPLGGGGGGAAAAAEGSGLDAHANSERLGEALGMARSALAELLLAGGGGGGGSEGGAAAAALALEVQGYALVLALGAQQAGAARGVLAQGAQLARSAPAPARAAWRSVLAPCLAWLGGRWPDFLRLVAALPRGGGAGQQQPALFFARCALHRLLPLARAQLLAALNEALGTPARPPTLPLSVLTGVLRLGSGGGGGLGEGATGSAGQGAGAGAGASSGGGGEGEPAWFRAARFAAQLGLQVVQGGGSAAPCGAGSLFELRRAWAAGEAGAQPAAGSLGVVLNKSQRLALGGGGGGGGDEALRALVALAPLREDADFFPASACGARSPGALADLISA